MNQIPDNLVEIGVYNSLKKANELGLVILSMRRPYWMFNKEGRVHLYVEGEYAAAVLEQIKKYERENRFWPPPPVALPDEKSTFLVLAFYVLILGLFFMIQQQHSQWFLEKAGMDSLALFRAKEWWRTVTALTLHADFVHLLANLMGGIFFGFFVNRTLGAGLGWLLILLSGAAGNAMTAGVYYPTAHLSLGASTAIFGALGILVGAAFKTGLYHAGIPASRNKIIPLLGGISLLGLMGTGDIKTDVLAHFFGFISGFLLGLGGAWIKEKLHFSDTLQKVFLLIILLLVAGAWTAAAYS